MSDIRIYDILRGHVAIFDDRRNKRPYRVKNIYANRPGAPEMYGTPLQPKRKHVSGATILKYPSMKWNQCFIEYGSPYMGTEAKKFIHLYTKHSYL